MLSSGSKCYLQLSNGDIKEMKIGISCKGKIMAEGMDTSCNMGNPSWILGKLKKITVM